MRKRGQVECCGIAEGTLHCFVVLQKGCRRGMQKGQVGCGWRQVEARAAILDLSLISKELGGPPAVAWMAMLKIQTQTGMMDPMDRGLGCLSECNALKSNCRWTEIIAETPCRSKPRLGCRWSAFEVRIRKSPNRRSALADCERPTAPLDPGSLRPSGHSCACSRAFP